MKFSYRAKEVSGELVGGLIEAEDQKTALARLRAQRFTVVEISQKNKKN